MSNQSDADRSEADVLPTSEQNLDNYVLTQDRVKRQIKPPARFAQADLIAFALNATDTLDNEPATYK